MNAYMAYQVSTQVCLGPSAVRRGGGFPEKASVSWVLLLSPQGLCVTQALSLSLLPDITAHVQEQVVHSEAALQRFPGPLREAVGEACAERLHRAPTPREEHSG